MWNMENVVKMLSCRQIKKSMQHLQNTINKTVQSSSRLKPDIQCRFEKFNKKPGLNKILNIVLRQHIQQTAD